MPWRTITPPQPRLPLLPPPSVGVIRDVGVVVVYVLPERRPMRNGRVLGQQQDVLKARVGSPHARDTTAPSPDDMPFTAAEEGLERALGAFRIEIESTG